MSCPTGSCNDLTTCPACGRLNDTHVNPDHCYACGHEWEEP